MELPDQILDGVRKIVDEKGLMAGNITRDVLESTIAKAMSNLIAFNSNHGQDLSSSSESCREMIFQVYTWGGGIHKLKEDFEFPSVDIATAWKLWWRGNPTTKTPPFKDISTLDLATKRKKQSSTTGNILWSK